MPGETFEERVLAKSDLPSLLCRPDMERSCGGCCGDFEQPRHILEGVFYARKQAYDARVQSEDGMLLYRKKMDLFEKGYRQCRFLAFLDDKNRTVGCLLHPGRPENKGRDLRDYGFYEDSGFCASNFCASSNSLLKRDMTDKQFFLLIQEDLDWYEYSRLFSCYINLKGTKGLFDIYVRYTRPLYKAILQRLCWRDLKGRGFLRRYRALLTSIVNRIRPSSCEMTRKGCDILFEDIMEILSDGGQIKTIEAEIDKFIKILVC